MARSNRLLRAAALGFAGAAAHGSVVSARHTVPGEPCGLRLPLSVPVGLLVGWGGGVAAPWPMPVTALWVTRRSGPSGPSRAWLCAAVGIGCLVGTAIEPVTHDHGSRTPAIRRAIALNVAASAALASIAAARLVVTSVAGGGATPIGGTG